MSSPLLPQAFWLQRVSMPCRPVDDVPKTRAGAGSKGRLVDLPPACALPDLASLDGRPSWSKLRLAWNPKGLGLVVEATGRPAPTTFDPDLPFAMPGVEIWIDTRDTRNVHRATRFCHRFIAHLVPPGSGTTLGVKLVQQTIHRASADAPKCRGGPASPR